MKLASASLSRRHALVTIGDRADEFTVEDLNSTNKSQIIDENSEPQAMKPGKEYNLSKY
mgnify:CR=1 FL=1